MRLNNTQCFTYFVNVNNEKAINELVTIVSIWDILILNVKYLSILISIKKTSVNK